MGSRLPITFYRQDVLKVAPLLPGKLLCVKGHDPVYITEVEAYRNEEDLACHASKGITNRTSVMYQEGGILYMYLVYGMHWMMNIVCGPQDYPQAALIRGVSGIRGPGRLTRELKLDGTYNGESLIHSERIWLEEGCDPGPVLAAPRIGIDYAGEPWKSIPWRFRATDLF